MDQPVSSSLPNDLIKAKAFTLSHDDIAVIEEVRREEGLRTDSSALRLLIRQGRKYRELQQQAEREVMGRLMTPRETGKE